MYHIMYFNVVRPRMFTGVAKQVREPVSLVLRDVAREASKRREQLRLEAMVRYTKQLVRKERNITLPRPVYEGPRNVRYWITRRRSGMRK